jgi:hypothetical protein
MSQPVAVLLSARRTPDKAREFDLVNGKMYSTNFRFTQAFVSQNVGSGGSVRFGWRTICPVSPAPFGGVGGRRPSGRAHDGADLDEILCVEEDRQVGNDNCVSYRTLKLQIRESLMRRVYTPYAFTNTSTPASTEASMSSGLIESTTPNKRRL